MTIISNKHSSQNQNKNKNFATTTLTQKRDSSEPRKDQQLKTDLLHVAIVDIYCTLKKQINKYSNQSTKGNKTGENEEEQLSEEE